MLTESIRGLRWTLSACLCTALCVGCGSSSKPAEEKADSAQTAASGPPVDPEPADGTPKIAAAPADSDKILRTAAVASPPALRVPEPIAMPEIAGPASSLDTDIADPIPTPETKPAKVDSATPEKPDADSPELQAAPQQGTPEWFVYESTKLRLQPIAAEEDADKARAARKQRNEKIVDLAQKAVGLVHDKPEKNRVFQTAIRHLIDARLQLALAGEKDHIDAMYDDAAALAKRDPQSHVAAEAARALVELAYINASKSIQKDDTAWLQEFAILATHFATQFPREEPRSAPLLFTAAQSCENYGLLNEAMNCYATILEKFPNNKYAAKSTGILRRLRLPGRTVDLSGPSLNGKKIDIASLRGRPVLVVFWATTAQRCIEEMPQIIEAAKKFTPNRLSVVGVCLDREPRLVSEFLISHKIGWPQIMHAATEEEKVKEKDPAAKQFDPALQWDHPIVNKYGVAKIPSLWLLDGNGKVVSTNSTVDDLEVNLTNLCNDPARATTAENEPAPRKSAKPRAARPRETETE